MVRSFAEANSFVLNWREGNRSIYSEIQYKLIWNKWMSFHFGSSWAEVPPIQSTSCQVGRKLEIIPKLGIIFLRIVTTSHHGTKLPRYNDPAQKLVIKLSQVLKPIKGHIEKVSPSWRDFLCTLSGMLACRCHIKPGPWWSKFLLHPKLGWSITVWNVSQIGTHFRSSFYLLVCRKSYLTRIHFFIGKYIK